MRFFGDSISGNCLKVKWTADHLGLPYEWVETRVLTGETRTPDFLAMNPAGQVPLAVLDDGRPLAQSNTFSLADMALLPYTRFTPEAGIDLSRWKSLAVWIGRSETVLGLAPLGAS